MGDVASGSPDLRRSRIARAGSQGFTVLFTSIGIALAFQMNTGLGSRANAEFYAIAATVIPVVLLATIARLGGFRGELDSDSTETDQISRDVRRMLAEAERSLEEARDLSDGVDLAKAERDKRQAEAFEKQTNARLERLRENQADNRIALMQITLSAIVTAFAGEAVALTGVALGKSTTFLLIFVTLCTGYQFVFLGVIELYSYFPLDRGSRRPVEQEVRN